jgi:very-short-patch-repair endonuclease
MLRKQATFPERLLWSRLRRRQLGTAFVRQQPIGRYIVDFYCPAFGLILELDGHSHDGRARYDAHRENVLRGRGYHIIRFSNDVVLRDVDTVVEQIYAVLVELRASREGDVS